MIGIEVVDIHDADHVLTQDVTIIQKNCHQKPLYLAIFHVVPNLLLPSYIHTPRSHIFRISGALHIQ